MAVSLAPLASLALPAARLAPLAPLGGDSPTLLPPRRRRRRKKQKPLTPEEEESILGGVMGTVQYLGETLDKPGRAVRGLLSGRPEAAMNLIPFSDTMGWTDPKKTTSGRDLLEQYAGAPRNKAGLFNSWEDAAWDIGGFAAEVGLDPLTFVTGPLGSLTKQGAAKVAGTGAKQLGTKGDDVLRMVKEVVEGTVPKGSQTLGKTPFELSKQILEGDRGVFGLKVPFAKTPFATFGTKSKLAAGAMDYLAYRGRFNPIPVARGLFSSTAGGHFTGAASRAADMMAMQKRQAVDQWMNVVPAMHQGIRDIEEQYFEMVKVARNQGDLDTFNDFTRRMLEEKTGLPSIEEMATGLRRHMMSRSPGAAIEGTEELAGELHKHLDAFRTLSAHAGKRVRELGFDMGVLDDVYAPHFPRRPGDPRLLDPDADLGNKFFDWQQARKDYLKQWPGNTANINAVARDGLITATKGASKAEREVILAQMRKELAEMGIEVGEKAGVKAVQRAYLWNKHARKPFDEAAAAGLLDELGLKAHVEQIAATAKVVGTKEAKATAKTEVDTLLAMGVDGGLGRETYREIGRNAEMTRFHEDGALDRMLNHFRNYPKAVQEKGLFDRRPVEDLTDYYRSMLEKEATMLTAHNYLKGSGATKVAMRAGDDGFEDGVSLAQAWKDAGFRKRGLEKFVRDNFGDVADDEIGDFVNSLTVRDGGQHVLKNLNESMKPRVQGAVVNWLDKVNSLFKGMVTIPFPSFHMRNFFSGAWMNWAEGDLPLIGLMDETYKSLKFALAGTGDIEYLDEMVQLGLMAGHATRQAEVGRAAVTLAGSAREELLGPGLVAGIKKSRKRDLFDPLAARGVKDTRNIVQLGGEKLYSVVEFANRATPYRMLRKKGYTSAQAYRKVMRRQFNYSELSEFERGVMAKIVPFYTWSRKSLPYSLAKLLEAPGGKTAQTIRALSQQPAEGEYRPSWLREGMSLRLPSGTPEATSYIKQGGLPVEDLNLLTWQDGLPDLERTGKKALSMTRQGIQAPLEWLTGEKLFTGQKLSEVKSTSAALTRPFGREIESDLFDEALARSPFSRVGTELSKIADYEGFEGGRKPLPAVLGNLFTGVKVTTQDAELQRQRDLREALREDILADPFGREGTHFYTPRRFKGTEDAARAEELIRREREAGEILKILQEDRDAKKKGKKKTKK